MVTIDRLYHPRRHPDELPNLPVPPPLLNEPCDARVPERVRRHTFNLDILARLLEGLADPEQGLPLPFDYVRARPFFSAA